MIDRGIRVCIGTDSAASNNKLDMFEEARFALLQQRSLTGKAVLTEQQILEMMTIRGAESLKMDKIVGSIEPGKKADLAVLKIPSYYKSSRQVLHHLIYNVGSADVLHTIINGEIVTATVSDSDVAKIYTKLS